MQNNQSLDDLVEEIKNCKKCPLCKYRKETAPGRGISNAEILFIGEGPEEKVDEEKILDELLAAIKLKREDVFITNVVKCNPPNNRDPLEEEIDVCVRNYLYKQINLIRPKLIVTLGRHSMQVFFPQIKSISEVHGKAYKKAGQVYLIFNLSKIIKDDYKIIKEILKLIK